MKYLNKLLGLGIVALALSSCSPAVTMAQDDEYQTQNNGYISNQEFYDELSPYGTWVNDARYGDVWVPDVDQDFRPYATNGHWVYTEYGNTWVSDYDWGWAAFHYGRWTYDDYYGWEWIPGNEWAPAWVDWRESEGYYGWAPLTPQVSFDLAYSSNYYIPDNYWSFAPYAYINSPNVYNYCVPYTRVRTIYARSSYIHDTYRYNNRQFFSGPRREDIQRRTNRPVRMYNVTNVNRPGSTVINNNSVNFYRPNIRTNGNARPTRVVDGAAYRQQNPGQRIGRNDGRFGAVTQGQNAQRLANDARSNNPDSRYVRINNDRRGMASPGNINRPGMNNGNGQQGGTYRNSRPGDNTNNQQTDQQRQQQQQAREQQRQQWQQQRQQQGGQLTDEQRQQQQQQTQQWRQQREQQRQQQGQQGQPGQQTDQQRQQQQQAREQQRQQWQQQRQQQGGQVTDEQRQQQQQQRQQWQQQRQQQRQQQGQQGQQQDQQRQQMQQQREQQRQQMQQQRDQMQQQQVQRQQQDQARQQQQEQQRQQMQQQREQQRQQQEQQRQQMQQQRDQQRQQQEQQRQQQDQQRQQQEQQRQQQDQQRQQQEQQRQQQQEQQRQQQEQQRQQQQQSQGQRPGRPGRP
ncbi:hypothetical protein DYU05_18105 [Mucilaginibacter terrenus]|uniref:Uncharacterized protein n=1 Tax=Mucilaginibacter terrenus TaxID=2482727 RepID=A0A3E2NL67_9SPHI|nr:DUF6600 domain-containing protein [Mucilaginibacter terrenus]RFZ81736.1 hypothetical protein DYU05_18105 [Mucilaginibacter terrenus]